MLKRTQISILILSLGFLAFGCDKYATPKLGASCIEDQECPESAFCVFEHGSNSKKVCAQKCGTNKRIVGTQTYPDCPTGWACEGEFQVKFKDTGERVYGSPLGDGDKLCIRK